MIRFFDDFLLALARRSRLAAALAAALVVALAVLIRPPTFAGSMIEQISADNPQVAAADRIAVAREHTKTVVAIIDPGNTIISRAFDDLRLLETRIAEVSTAADVRSVHAYADQLFLLRLELDDSLADFLLAIQPGAGGGEEPSKSVGARRSVLCAPPFLRRAQGRPAGRPYADVACCYSPNLYTSATFAPMTRCRAVSDSGATSRFRAGIYWSL